MKTKEGISLIVLVITIIVMTILSGAIIISLSNNGIIDRASEAVEQANIATVKEIAQIAWAEAHAKAIIAGESQNEEKLLERLQTAVADAFEANKIDKEKYGTVVTTTGVEVANGWIQDGLKVKRGTIELDIGQTINYNAGVEGYSAGWKVLGAKDGELLILSNGHVMLGSSPGFWGPSDYISNAVAMLNDTCEPYGKGKGATGARSITVDDVNRVTGYDPQTANYAKDAINEYGNKVTYWWTGNDDPYYTATNKVDGDIAGYWSHNGTFKYFNGKNFSTSTKPVTETLSEPVEITTLTSDDYMYYATTLTENSTDAKKGLVEGSPAYDMLFNYSPDYETPYYLASTCIKTDSDGVWFNIRVVNWGQVSSAWCDSSFYIEYDGYSADVRAVVSLARDVQIDKTTGNIL